MKVIQHYHEPPAASSWMLHPAPRWFAKCDKCQRRRLRANYFEVYHQKCGKNEGRSCWWWECGGCLLESITQVAEAQQKKESDVSSMGHP